MGHSLPVFSSPCAKLDVVTWLEWGRTRGWAERGRPQQKDEASVLLIFDFFPSRPHLPAPPPANHPTGARPKQLCPAFSQPPLAPSPPALSGPHLLQHDGLAELLRANGEVLLLAGVDKWSVDHHSLSVERAGKRVPLRRGQDAGTQLFFHDTTSHARSLGGVERGRSSRPGPRLATPKLFGTV